MVDQDNMEITSRLQISNLKAANKGFYTCEASNSAPNAVTKKAYLTVQCKIFEYYADLICGHFYLWIWQIYILKFWVLMPPAWKVFGGI